MEAGEAAGPGQKRQQFSTERDFGEAQGMFTEPIPLAIGVVPETWAATAAFLAALAGAAAVIPARRAARMAIPRRAHARLRGLLREDAEALGWRSALGSR
jgi:hypothetical protein